MAEEKAPRVVVTIPIERGGVPADEIFWNFVHIAQQGWSFMPTSYGRTDYVRNKCAQGLLDSDFSHLVMLDSDHMHPLNVVAQLAADVARHPDKLVIGGLHYRRGEPYDPLVFLKNEKGLYCTYPEWPKGLLEVDAVGMASTIIARQVFERIEPPWFVWEYPPQVKDFNYPGEDVYFCKRCQEHGIGVWVDTSITSPHLARRYIDKVTLDEYLKQHPEMLHESKGGLP